MALCCPNFQWRFWVRWLVSFANQSYLKGCSQWTGVIIHAAVGADSHSNSKPENSKEDCPNDFNWKSQSETYFSISTFSRKNSNLRVGFILHLFAFYFIYISIYGPLHVLWQVSFGSWVSWSISSWQKNYKSVLFYQTCFWMIKFTVIPKQLFGTWCFC